MKIQRGCLPVEIQNLPDPKPGIVSLTRVGCVVFLCEEGGRYL